MESVRGGLLVQHWLLGRWCHRLMHRMRWFYLNWGLRFYGLRWLCAEVHHEGRLWRLRHRSHYVFEERITRHRRVLMRLWSRSYGEALHVSLLLRIFHGRVSPTLSAWWLVRRHSIRLLARTIKPHLLSLVPVPHLILFPLNLLWTYQTNSFFVQPVVIILYFWQLIYFVNGHAV